MGDLHARIGAVLDEYDTDHGSVGCVYQRCIHDAVEALRAVMQLHQPETTDDEAWCDGCRRYAASGCRELVAIAAALGIKDGEVR